MQKHNLFQGEKNQHCSNIFTLPITPIHIRGFLEGSLHCYSTVRPLHISSGRFMSPVRIIKVFMCYADNNIDKEKRFKGNATLTSYCIYILLRDLGNPTKVLLMMLYITVSHRSNMWTALTLSCFID